MASEEVTIIPLKDDWWYKVRIPSGKKLIKGFEEAIEKIKKNAKKILKSFTAVGLGGGLKNVLAQLSQCQKLHGSDSEEITLPNPGIPGIYELNSINIEVTTKESDGKQHIHCHASLTGGKKLDKPTGGHIVESDVELTVNLDVFASEVEIFRSYDEKTGLSLKLTSERTKKSNH